MAPFIQILVSGLFLSETGMAVPEYVSGEQIRFLIGKPRSSVIIAFNAGTIDKPEIKRAYPAIVPMNRDGQMIWFEGTDWADKNVGDFDRIAIERDLLGEPVSGNVDLTGCQPKNGIAIKTPQGQGWLASCTSETIKSIPAHPARVTYREDIGEVSSKYYSYRFKKENHMLFDSLTLKGDRDDVIARDSDLYIKSDVKNFFTLNFSSADVESKIMSSRIDPMAAFASLGFYLKVLFFRISLDLRTDAAFFESSANIPMVITLPVNAKKRLNTKSGVLYSFVVGDGVNSSDIKTDMPILESKLFSEDYISVGSARCQRICHYELLVSSVGRILKLKLAINRSLVERGLFPWFVPDVSEAKKSMGWSFRRGFEPKKRIGIYLEMSGLPEGSHPWDFWIGF